SGTYLWMWCRSTDKRYPGDNRLIFPKSPYRRDGLAPRCRLVASWGWSRSQGLGCSPIKAARELGSERRATVRSLSAARVETRRRLSLVREDRDGRTSGVPVVPPGAGLVGYVRKGSPLKASKREACIKMRFLLRFPTDYRVDRSVLYAL